MPIPEYSYNSRTISGRLTAVMDLGGSPGSRTHGHPNREFQCMNGTSVTFFAFVIAKSTCSVTEMMFHIPAAELPAPEHETKSKTDTTDRRHCREAGLQR
jgi:hypothetical protein